MLSWEIFVQGYGFNFERGLPLATIVSKEDEMTTILGGKKSVNILLPTIKETHKLQCSPNNIRFFIQNMLNNNVGSEYFCIEASITTVNEN